MNYESWHVDSQKIFPKIFVPSRYTSIACNGRRTSSQIPICLYCLFAHSLAHQQISIEEILEELCKECITISCYCFLDPIKDSLVHAFGIVLRFKQERWNGAYEDCLFHAFGSVLSKVSSYFASS